MTKSLPFEKIQMTVSVHTKITRQTTACLKNCPKNCTICLKNCLKNFSKSGLRQLQKGSAILCQTHCPLVKSTCSLKNCKICLKNCLMRHDTVCDFRVPTNLISMTIFNVIFSSSDLLQEKCAWVSSGLKDCKICLKNCLKKTVSMSIFNGIFLLIFYRRNVHESPLVLPSRAFGLWQKALRSTWRDLCL